MRNVYCFSDNECNVNFVEFSGLVLSGLAQYKVVYGLIMVNMSYPLIIYWFAKVSEFKFKSHQYKGHIKIEP